jgi:hypothetical protein
MNSVGKSGGLLPLPVILGVNGVEGVKEEEETKKGWED